ncbi:MFS transporter [Marivirga arenosa]|uniref:MFS transporter n=1 Tax=Marivirga arenosa TaxID=3059076 RepID=A0AA51X3D2_9BACT|nr:MFS transporter [Marivirga sp. BKB1-2]WNB16972.1 MFS transporter [Marivirga sp. BKB1-2]
MQINNSKTINTWCMYDWANSVYAIVIKSSIFPVFYNTATQNAFNGDVVDFFGFKLVNTALYSFAISFSFLIVAIISPLLSGIADYTSNKKSFMQFFTYLGGLSCIGLFFFTGKNVEWAIICSVLASIGFTGSLVFYNAFLPIIATPDKHDMISAKGYSLGYIGSIILLVINLVCISNPDWFGLEKTGIIARFSFLTVGLWWIGFAQITFRALKEVKKEINYSRSIIVSGYKEIIKVFKELNSQPILKYFLSSFFFYSMGVQTVMYMAASFGSKELNLPGNKLIITIIIINAVAIIGSYGFAYISKKKTNKFSLLNMLVIWVGICIYAYFVYTDYQFYLLAFIVGLVMGGIQSLSRSTYSKIMPQNSHDEASYFSFYDVTEKIAVVIGTFSYGFIEQWTGSMRNSTIALGLFFAIGMGLLLMVRIPSNLNYNSENN